MQDNEPGPLDPTVETVDESDLTLDLTQSPAGGAPPAGAGGAPPAGAGGAPPAGAGGAPPAGAGGAPPAGAGGAPPAGAGGAPLTLNVTNASPSYALTPYIPDKQRDYVRLIVTVGLLVMLGWIILWASIESASWPDHWNQTKEMLQTILPAVTGLIGSVIGFYFGSGVNSNSNNNSIGNNSLTK